VVKPAHFDGGLDAAVVATLIRHGNQQLKDIAVVGSDRPNFHVFGKTLENNSERLGVAVSQVQDLSNYLQ